MNCSTVTNRVIYEIVRLEKIALIARDNRGLVFDESRIALPDTFKKELEMIYAYIDDVVTDMDTDIVAGFYSRERIPLGYFYQAEYHLGEKQRKKRFHRGS